MKFPSTGHQLTISEQYLGVDVFGYLRANVDLRGTLPSIATDAKLVLPDFSIDYNFISANQLRAHSSRAHRLEGIAVDTPFTVDQTITFNGCSFIPDERRAIRIHVGHCQIVYDVADEKEPIVRYAANYQTSPASGITANQLLNDQH